MLVFEYANEDGVIADHTVRNWRDEGRHFRGFCLANNEVRTFRKDRILQWREGPAEVREIWLAERQPRKLSKAPEVAFTGFPSAEKAALKEAALAAGFIVRSDVTEGLNVLVCGPLRPGPAKVKLAIERGAMLVTSEAFRDQCAGRVRS